MTPNCEALDLRHSLDDRNAFLGRSIAGERSTLDRVGFSTAYEIAHAALQGISQLDQTSGAETIGTFLVFLNLLERHSEVFGKILLAHFDLVTAGPNAFAEGNVRILNPPSIRLGTALSLHTSPLCCNSELSDGKQAGVKLAPVFMPFLATPSFKRASREQLLALLVWMHPVVRHDLPRGLQLDAQIERADLFCTT